MKRNKFSLSYTYLLSCDMGELVPIGLTEVLPGDSFRHSTSAFIRLSAMLAPIMHSVDVRIHHWFVPHRLVWVDFEKFITGGADGLDASVFPTITINAAVGGLADYLGVPTGTSIAVSALPFRGYAMIFNEWYRDQDLVTALPLQLTSGPDAVTNTVLQNCAWEKDYFTSARPWEQKGPSVSIPLTGNAPVTGIGINASMSSLGSQASVRETAPGSSVTYPAHNQLSHSAWLGRITNAGASARPDIFADLSGISAVTVNALRQALAIQRYEEGAARYGSRYPEYLARLGVRSSDGRLQRPEYLGGGKSKVQFSEIAQTSPSTADSSVTGDLKGHGMAALRSNRYVRFFEEHGYVYTLFSVRPKTVYANGLFRHWNRRTKFDFWQPELQHIGQQPIANKEVYVAHASPDAVFGYQDRFDEYRRSESRIGGEFRSTLLDYWHMARIFSSAPALNSTFVTSVPTERGFAVPAEDVLQINVKHNLQARRLLSKTGTSFTF